MSLWWWITAGVLAFFALALTGILDLLFAPLLRRLLGDDGYEEAAESARNFRQDQEAHAEARSDQVAGFARAVWDTIRGR